MLEIFFKECLITSGNLKEREGGSFIQFCPLTQIPGQGDQKFMWNGQRRFKPSCELVLQYIRYRSLLLKQALWVWCCFIFQRQTNSFSLLEFFFSKKDPAGEIRPAGLSSPITQRHLHGDRLSRKHDAPHPVFKEWSGEAEEAAEGRSVTAYVASGFPVFCLQN